MYPVSLSNPRVSFKSNTNNPVYNFKGTNEEALSILKFDSVEINRRSEYQIGANAIRALMLDSMTMYYNTQDKNFKLRASIYSDLSGSNDFCNKLGALVKQKVKDIYPQRIDHLS